VIVRHAPPPAVMFAHGNPFRINGLQPLRSCAGRCANVCTDAFVNNPIRAGQLLSAKEFPKSINLNVLAILIEE
jgi:hypothetical protein